jgi:hypothetical protein
MANLKKQKLKDGKFDSKHINHDPDAENLKAVLDSNDKSKK